MKLKILLLSFLAVFLLVPLADALPIDVDEIIWQEDVNLNSSSLSATVNFTTIDSNSFLITLTNTSSLDDPIDFDFPASVLLTGIGFTLPEGYSIGSGGVAGTNATNFDGSTASQYWGYDQEDENAPIDSGPFANVTTLSVNTAVSTLQAAVETAFAPEGNINGPQHGILSEAYSHHNYPYFNGYALITVDLNEDVSDWGNFFNGINFDDVVVAFGSPTAPIPEPATMLLLGSGLIGLAAVGRKKFRKNNNS
jgi:hypothetical protein